jgi:hypothetical protein
MEFLFCFYLVTNFRGAVLSTGGKYNSFAKKAAILFSALLKKWRKRMNNSGKNFTKSHVIRKHRDIEHILYASFFVVFLALIITQAAIFIPSIKLAVMEKDSMMGVPIGKEEYLYKEGNLELTLVDFENYPALKVLVNGDEKASFQGKTVSLEVLDGDVVELDGSGTNASTGVSASSVSENMDKNSLGKHLSQAGRF